MNSEVFSKTEKAGVNKPLKEACEGIANLNMAILSTSDGHVVTAHSLKPELDYHRLSAMAASFAGLSYTMADETKIGTVNRATIEAEAGLLLSQLISIKNKEFALTMIFDSGVKAGMAHWAMTNISKKVLDLF